MRTRCASVMLPGLRWGSIGQSSIRFTARLGERLDAAGCDHSMRFTEQWAVARQSDWTRLTEALGNAGGYCDCEVLANTDPDQTL